MCYVILIKKIWGDTLILEIKINHWPSHLGTQTGLAPFSSHSSPECRCTGSVFVLWRVSLISFMAASTSLVFSPLVFMRWGAGAGGGGVFSNNRNIFIETIQLTRVTLPIESACERFSGSSKLFTQLFMSIGDVLMLSFSGAMPFSLGFELQTPVEENKTLKTS